MERITSVNKQSEDSALRLGKLKLNMGDSTHKNIEKTIRYITKNLLPEERTTQRLIDAIKTLLPELYESEDIELMHPSENLTLWSGKSFSYDNYMEFQNKKNSWKEMAYFDLDGKIPATKHYNKFTWKKSDKGSFRVFNGLRLIAMDKMARELFGHPGTVLKVMRKEIEKQHPSIRVDNISIEIFSDFNRMYNKLSGYSFTQESFSRNVILSLILEKYEDDLNLELMKKYEKTQSGNYAKSFVTKKNITATALERMENNKFLGNGFSFVEFDVDTDLEKISQIENEWKVLYQHILPKTDVDIDLRFRRLGNHKAIGLYYPLQKCLCVDIRNIQAMVHEYGHHLDYEYGEEPLSLGEDFRDIIHNYRKNASSELDKDSYVSKKLNYYTTPTEVFARGYELYLSIEKGISSSFLKEKSTYETLDEYKCFDEQTRKELFRYFNNLFEKKEERRNKNGNEE